MCVSMGVGWVQKGGKRAPPFDLHVLRLELVSCIWYIKHCRVARENKALTMR